MKRSTKLCLIGFMSSCILLYCVPIVESQAEQNYALSSTFTISTETNLSYAYTEWLRKAYTWIQWINWIKTQLFTAKERLTTIFQINSSQKDSLDAIIDSILSNDYLSDIKLTLQIEKNIPVIGKITEDDLSKGAAINLNFEASSKNQLAVEGCRTFIREIASTIPLNYKLKDSVKAILIDGRALLSKLPTEYSADPANGPNKMKDFRLSVYVIEKADSHLEALLDMSTHYIDLMKGAFSPKPILMSLQPSTTTTVPALSLQ